MPGPIPKRSDQRRRVNKTPGGITSAPAGAVAVAPAANPEWHPMAADWYASLAASGQSAFYEPSDWETARIWAEVLSRQLSADKMSAMMIASWAASATELLTTEGSRRRGRLELLKSDPVDEDAAHGEATVTDLMSRLGG